MQALSGIRVLDLTRGPVGGMATMVLGDFGAEVLRLVKPGVEDPLENLAAAPMWRRGTCTVELDVRHDRERFDALCAAADVLMCNWRPSALERAGIEPEALAERFPHLVIASVTSFGHGDPRSELPGYEHVVAAAIGRMRAFGGCADRDGPVFSALQVGVHACAQALVSSICAALVSREQSGHGSVLRTSMLQAMIVYEQGAMIGQQFSERFGPLVNALPGASPQAPMPTLHYLPTQAGDGRWIQLGNLLPHLFDNFLLATDLFDILADPEFDSAQMNLPVEKREAFRERMLARMQEKPSDEWMDIFVRNGGVVAGKVQSSQEALEDPDVAANGHVVSMGDGYQLGPLAKLSRTPAVPGSGVQDGADVAARWAQDPRVMTMKPRSANLPLHGVRVVEIATIIAAPFGASLLAELGADVIKVEPVAGDPYRGMAGGVGAARVNLGKRSIAVNLKSEAGQQVVADLLAEADVLIHNFRPGVPEKLGIGFESVHAGNPDLIYMQSNGYGPDGPGAHRPSTHPIPGAAMGGVLLQMAGTLPSERLPHEALVEWSRRIMRANEVNPDPNTAVVIASAAAIALLARARGAGGQLVCVDMFGANAYANADDFLRYPGKADRMTPDPDLYGFSARYRLYECVDGWMFLAIPSDGEAQRFKQALQQNGIELPDVNDTGAMEACFRRHTVREWQAVFDGTDVACVQADHLMPKDFWLAEAQRAFSQPSVHPDWGAFRRPGPVVRFDGVEPAALDPPEAGQHTAAILVELGQDPGDVQALRDAGAIR